MVDVDLIERVTRAIEQIRQGRMVILVDDEDRENEGDLTMAAELVTPEAINFMAKYGRGLICVTLQEEQVERLQLPMMTAPGHGSPPLGTAFTVSIEARHGVTTGISAADRARTIQVASDPSSKPEDLVTPGHVFPLKARAGGVLVRTGQTEGSVDLAYLAGLRPAGVICEIMKDDGTMARMPDLEKFAEEHDLMILSVADLIQYRTQTERLVERVSSLTLRLDETGNEWQAYMYKSKVEGSELLALVLGDVSNSDEPVMCRVHRGSTIGDVLSSGASEGGKSLRKAIRKIEAAGKGVVLYLPPRYSLAEEFELHRRSLERKGKETKEKKVCPLREFGLGAQVLAELGLSKISILTNNPRKIAGIAGYGLEVVESISLR